MAGELYGWAAGAGPGEGIIYFTGHLAYAREKAAIARRVIGDAARDPGLDRAADAFRLCESGHVVLVQRRRGPNEWDYEAYRTKKSMRLPLMVAA